MARRKVEELKKHTLNLRDGDIEKIEALFPGKSPSVIVRKIVSKFVDNVSATAEMQVKVDVKF